ncbi:SgcJ/EcaC family oxidoreductase [Adhaeribacter pallidiroseus]|uniref:DUF4440 domain-containing protein n=1 Tax=Adhaeribacter pallidiroseus TaxID=2072847 RepID=A0A369QMV0_9BACT|nr:SgcJ/EcaC family oxidoreductase [Adhaeribacter pallidiroseus]RDC66251.1 hypothetical protein AHMF7616_04882 [Adhaeribacter pallidiroseus]
MATTLISVFLLLAPALAAQHIADSLAILAILQEEVTSWNNGDAPAYAKYFSEHGTFTNIRGMYFTGYKQFFDRHVDLFQGIFSKTVLQQEIISLRFLGSDVAIAETLTWISKFSPTNVPQGVPVDSLGRIYTRLLQVFQKEAGDWMIVAYHNIALKAGTPVPEPE